ncbi:MAG: hypothetical protein Tsb0015_02940 [Simkaniaceae bacterium]
MKNLFFLFAFLPLVVCAEVEIEKEDKPTQDSLSIEDKNHIPRSNFSEMDFEEEIADNDLEEDFPLFEEELN